MQGFTHAALAGALVLAAGFAPAAGAHGQERDGIVRAMQISRGSRIGASLQDFDDAAAKDAKLSRQGVLVTSVEPGGPADAAGIKPGDAIVEFDGDKVRSVRQMSRLVQETPSGHSVAVTLLRS